MENKIKLYVGYVSLMKDKEITVLENKKKKVSSIERSAWKISTI